MATRKVKSKARKAAKPLARKPAKRAAPKKAAGKPKAVPFMPKGYHTVTPYLALRDAAKAIDFYKKAFGAVEKFRMPGPDGRIGHAEIVVGGSTLMMAEESAPLDFNSPPTLGGSSVMMHVYVPNVDAFVAKAVAAGAKLTRAVETQFYGDRGGSLVDPFGHMWYFATHVEEVPPAELESRAAEAMKKKPPGS